MDWIEYVHGQAGGKADTSTVSQSPHQVQGGYAPSLAQLTSSLLTLENNVTWDAVDSSWQDRREAWRKEVQHAVGSSSVARLLWEFEQSVHWNAVSDSWKEQRSEWVESCRSGASPAAVAALMLQFERGLLWSSVGSKWEGIRPQWIEVLSGRST